MKPRVLWVEDSARLELNNLLGPVLLCGRYEFSLAEDLTKAVRLLELEQFEALIVDIRLPPGTDPAWCGHYRRAGSDKVAAQLGLTMLYWLLGRRPGYYPTRPPNWVSAERIGVFSVEERCEVARSLDELGIRTYARKGIDVPDTVLLRLIEEVLGQSGNGSRAAAGRAAGGHPA